jgi:hypothetical protein
VIAYFKERNSFQVPALLFVTMALKLVFIYHPHFDTSSEPGGLLPAWLNGSVLPRLNPVFAATLSQLVLFLSALFANYLLSSSRMFGRNNLLVALSMLLFTSLFPTSNQLSSTIFLLPLVILLFRQVTKLYNRAKARPVIINIGMIAGVGYLLYHPFIWLLPCCFIGLAGMRPFKLTEWLLLLLGFLTPAYFLLSYEFFTDQWHPYRHLISWSYYTHLPKISLYLWLGAGLVFIWLMAAIPVWQRHMRRMLIQSRKNWYQLIFLGLFILPMAFFPTGNTSEALTLLSFPAASIASNAFTGEKTFLSVLLFWLLVVAIIISGWAYIQPA